MDNAANFPLLTLILFTPTVGAVLLLFVNKRQEDLIGGSPTSSPWPASSCRCRCGSGTTRRAQMAVRRAGPVDTIDRRDYFLGVDGFSVLLILLTTLMGCLAILSSWTAITERVKEYYILLLVLQTGMLGAFMALDFLLFFLFWEVMLVPMYFLIGVWGSDRRLYSAIKFFLYTLVGSVVMLLGILALYFYNHT